MRAHDLGHCRGFGAALLAGASMALANPAVAQTGPTAIPTPAPAPVVLPAPTAGARATSLWGGVDVSPSSKALWGGGVHALNGDLSEDGFLVRASFTLGEYEAGILSDDERDVSFQNASLMIGYHRDLGTARVGFFVGPDFTHNGNGASPDVRGSEWGVRGIADIVVPVSPQFDLSSWATYTTIESQYYVQGRALYRPSRTFRVGPEVAVLGGDTWSQQRAGGHAAFAIPGGEIGISAGHAWNNDSDAKDGLYASAIVSVSF